MITRKQIEEAQAALTTEQIKARNYYTRIHIVDDAGQYIIKSTLHEHDEETNDPSALSETLKAPGLLGLFFGLGLLLIVAIVVFTSPMEPPPSIDAFTVNY